MKAIAALLALGLSAQLHAHSVSDDLLGPTKEIIATYKYNAYHLDMMDLRSKDIEILGVDLKRGTIDLFLSKDQFRWMQLTGYKLTMDSEKNAPMAVDPEYKSPEEIEAFLKRVNEQYPDITKLVSIGKSLEGRDIWALKISDNASVDETEPAVLFNSMHHAREVMTPEVGVDIIEQLTQGYERDEKLTAYVNNYEIWVVPMFNVDGNAKVWNGSTMWRKNTRGGYGVDINRNYPFKWGSCNGSSNSSWAQDYRGPAAASEPETNVMMNLVKEIRPVFDISFHSYSELVIYPYGCSGQRSPTAEVVESIGKEMAGLIGYKPGTAWETLYSVDGGDIDWMYNEYQVIPYVIEVNSSREGFQPRYDLWRDKTVTLIRKAWTLVLDKMAGSGVRGKVLSAEGGAVTQFNVVVEKVVGAQTTLFQNYRGNPDGTFHVILKPGDYKLSFQVGGRAVQTKLVKITDGRHDIEIQL